MFEITREIDQYHCIQIEIRMSKSFGFNFHITGDVIPQNSYLNADH